MPEYSSPNEEDLSIEEQKWIFKCRVEDIQIKGNHRWKFQDISCFSCKQNTEKTQEHLLHCSYLSGMNENVMYIPEYSELFKGSLEEQIYVASLLQENYNNRLSED